MQVRYTQRSLRPLRPAPRFNSVSCPMTVSKLRVMPSVAMTDDEMNEHKSTSSCDQKILKEKQDIATNRTLRRSYPQLGPRLAARQSAM
jgi:hypothetical protein